MKNKKPSFVAEAQRGSRTKKLRVVGAGISSTEFQAQQVAKRGWFINPRTGLRVAIA